MAFEDMTYEYLTSRMMDRIIESYPNLDTREGSMVFQSVASAAMELAIAYQSLDYVLNESFIDTASREYLLKACDQMGIDTSMFDSTVGIFKGEFDTQIPIDSRWNLGVYNYTATEYIGQNEETDLYEYELTCDTYGSEANAVFGNLTPIDYITGSFTIAKVTACLIPGEEERTDDYIKQVYGNYVGNRITDGNVNQYKEWCAEFDGIGANKIIPLWNGDNTVKVSILDSDNKPASSTLINLFQAYLDPLVDGSPSGMGDGVAPIGAFVTVSTATELPLNFSATVTLKEGYSTTTQIDDAIRAYLKESAYSVSKLSYMKLGAVILGAEGVDFITNLTVNDGTSDITLTTEQIGKLGTTTWTVAT